MKEKKRRKRTQLLILLRMQYMIFPERGLKELRKEARAEEWEGANGQGE